MYKQSNGQMCTRASIREGPSAGSQCYSVNLVTECQKLVCIGLCCCADDNVTGKDKAWQTSLCFLSRLSFLKDDNKTVHMYSRWKGLFETLRFSRALIRQVALVSSLRNAFL